MSCVAVIPVRRGEQTIGATLESLRLGNAPFVERVLVVTSVGDPTSDVVRRWNAQDARVELLAGPEPLTAGAARNIGRAAIHDDLILFIDADCRLEAGGAVRLASELHRSGAAAVTARVLGEGGVVARVRHILEFKEAASARPAPDGWLPPSTVMLCRTDAFDRAGGFPDMWPGEDLVFTHSLRDLGERVDRSNSVRAVHRHPAGVREMLRHQLRLGTTAAVARRARPMRGSEFARNPWRAALLLPARIVRIAAWQAREGRVAFAWTLLLSPLLLAGLAAWTVGFVSVSSRRPLRPVAAAAGAELPAA